MMGLVSAISGATEQDINWKNVSILGSGGSDVEREFPCGALLIAVSVFTQPSGPVSF